MGGGVPRLAICCQIARRIGADRQRPKPPSSRTAIPSLPDGLALDRKRLAENQENPFAASKRHAFKRYGIAMNDDGQTGVLAATWTCSINLRTRSQFNTISRNLMTLPSARLGPQHL